MSRMARRLRVLSAFTLVVSLLVPLAASAHESVTAGDYTIEYGWLSEPPIVGQPNAIVINISEREASHSHAPEGAISFVAPADGADVHGDSVKVMVKFDGLDEHAGDQGMHWHLYFDDKVLTMLSAAQTTATITGLTNGRHTLKAALSGGDHVEFGEAATAAIHVEGASDTGNPSVSGVEAVSDEHSPEAFADVDVSQLTLEVVYGGKSKPLALQPLGENTPGQLIAPLTPTRAGQFTLRLGGKIGDTDVSAEVEPEEVQSADAVQFPQAAAAETQDAFGLTGWLGLAGLVFGLVGIGLGVYGLTRKK